MLSIIGGSLCIAAGVALLAVACWLLIAGAGLIANVFRKR